MPLSRALTAAALAALLVLPSIATAKSPKSMSGPELVDALRAPGTVRRIEGVIEEIAARRVEVAIEPLGAACLSEGELCPAVLTALGRYGSAEALDQVEAILVSSTTLGAYRTGALVLLMDRNPERVDALIADLIAWYRHHDTALNVALLEALAERKIADLGDMAVFIAGDLEADRHLRLTAAQVAGELDHPRIYDVYIALLEDDDAAVRAEAAQALGGKGYPGAVVVPPLKFAARHDGSGAVRAAAILSLRFYSHADLLPVVHHAVQHETNPMAWACSILMLEALADRSSVHPIHELLKRREKLEPATQVQLMRLLVRIGDQAGIPVLHAAALRTGDPDVRQAAQNASALLTGPEEQRLAALSQWTFGVGVYPWDPDVPRVPRKPLRVELDESDVLIWVGE